ncbi:hypothetical protein L226DRAFT_548691 [Lentinus tigrinus ALCF2SS1-7]|uniref:CxC2-like cysteine cluster KDZ transposase-associated domain-containing protein n=1 Tax=Lentinus tigrinus ALCF2SS1-6 TaxID=1328759 RepID=A0A5C2RP48_9APHY|nr:hypothetical protein L227DRAFT_589609 [Lentinus tigrinus ALCF2SS1-6]RPD68024.1 hypothetical protein L226DRAFT_548691 [Lentinus tigrinus ALCF2SS1-7]
MTGDADSRLLQVWDGEKFARTSLENLGMKIQLGHSSGLYENGKPTPDWRQFMRLGWFPATMDKPATVFTFRMLHTFQELNFQGKTNLHDFWKTIEHITDNSGGVDVPNRYQQFCHVFRIWRHLVMLKRFGRGHDPAGAGATQAGELVLDCAACPHPEKNLPDDWEKAPPHRRTAENTCSAEHNTILKANLRKEGYIASGIGAVLCARHALVRKNGAGDLDLGEGYANMDYLIFSTLIGILLLALLLSYDIACQWSKRFFTRMRENFPPTMQIDWTRHHYRVHGGEPHSRWSLNFLRWVGRTYGEGIESQWSHINLLALSMREMGLGMRITLLRALDEACEMSIKQRKVYQDYTANIPAETIDEWDTMLKAWHADPDQPDPFQEPTIDISLAAVKLQLNEEEAVEAAAGRLPSHDDVTPGVLLQVGLELEEKQRALRLRARTQRSLSELAQHQQKRNALWRRIELWQAGQDYHMPMVAELRSSTSSDSVNTPIKAEDVPLWLPSALPATFPLTESLLALRDKERRLRIAQMADSLAGIRHVRRVLAAISEFTRMNVSGLGQRSVTPARVAMESLDPDGSWTHTYRPLLDEDLRGPRREQDEVVPSEGRYVPSWIWLTPASSGTPRDGNEAASDEEFATQRTGCHARLRRGLSIYAHKEAAIWEALAGRTASFWVHKLEELGPLPGWIVPYQHLARKVRSRAERGGVLQGDLLDPELSAAEYYRAIYWA